MPPTQVRDGTVFIVFALLANNAWNSRNLQITGWTVTLTYPRRLVESQMTCSALSVTCHCQVSVFVDLHHMIHRSAVSVTTEPLIKLDMSGPYTEHHLRGSEGKAQNCS